MYAGRRGVSGPSSLTYVPVALSGGKWWEGGKQKEGEWRRGLFSPNLASASWKGVIGPTSQIQRHSESWGIHTDFHLMAARAVARGSFGGAIEVSPSR